MSAKARAIIQQKQWARARADRPGWDVADARPVGAAIHRDKFGEYHDTARARDAADARGIGPEDRRDLDGARGWYYGTQCAAPAGMRLLSAGEVDAQRQAGLGAALLAIGRQAARRQSAYLRDDTGRQASATSIQDAAADAVAAVFGAMSFCPWATAADIVGPVRAGVERAAGLGAWQSLRSWSAGGIRYRNGDGQDVPLVWGDSDRVTVEGFTSGLAADLERAAAADHAAGEPAPIGEQSARRAAARFVWRAVFTRHQGEAWPAGANGTRARAAARSVCRVLASAVLSGSPVSDTWAGVGIESVQAWSVLVKRVQPWARIRSALIARQSPRVRELRAAMRARALAARKLGALVSSGHLVADAVRLRDAARRAADEITAAADAACEAIRKGGRPAVHRHAVKRWATVVSTARGLFTPAGERPAWRDGGPVEHGPAVVRSSKGKLYRARPGAAGEVRLIGPAHVEPMLSRDESFARQLAAVQAAARPSQGGRPVPPAGQGGRLTVRGHRFTVRASGRVLG